MEDFSYTLEKTKFYVRELLQDFEIIEIYSENYIEDCFFDPFIFTADPYKLALRITDSLIHSTPIH